MEVKEAKEILGSLANGIDPITGEVFPENSPYNHPTVIRALFTILGNIRVPQKRTKLSIEQKQKQNLENGKPKNAGIPWTSEMKQNVAKMFNDGTSTQELASYFERTEGAIQSELEHQGLFEAYQQLHSLIIVCAQ